jgi:thioredoxin-related protein
LTREVFSTAEFKKWAHKKVVLVHIDSPRKTKLPEELQKQNEALKSKFSIRGFPTVLFIDAKKEKVLGRSGYLREKGPEAWIKAAEKELK